MTLQPRITRAVKPPRAVHLRYPFGHPMGEAFHVAQQRAILRLGLQALETITVPGTIIEPGWAWKRHRFE